MFICVHNGVVFSDLNINTVVELRTKNVNVDKYERRVCSADLSLTGTISLQNVQHNADRLEEEQRRAQLQVSIKQPCAPLYTISD